VLAADGQHGDGGPHALERAITNLVENAVKFDDREAVDRVNVQHAG